MSGNDGILVVGILLMGFVLWAGLLFWFFGGFLIEILRSEKRGQKQHDQRWREPK